MARSKPIPVRWSDEEIMRLERAAKQLGLRSRTDVIKICVRAFLDAFERIGKAALPLEWEQLLRSMDGRTTRYSCKRGKANGKAALKMVAEERAPYGSEGDAQDDTGGE
jgi:hypothetical protein